MFIFNFFISEVMTLNEQKAEWKNILRRKRIKTFLWWDFYIFMVRKNRLFLEICHKAKICTIKKNYLNRKRHVLHFRSWQFFDIFTRFLDMSFQSWSLSSFSALSRHNARSFKSITTLKFHISKPERAIKKLSTTKM